MVPNGWKLTSLGEVCSGSLQTGPFGSQLHAHEYTDEGVPVLMPKDLINYRANNESAAKIPEHRADDLKKHTLQSGDLLFSRRGDVARFALIESDYPRSLCGTGCLKATPNKAHSSLFLSYFLQKSAVKRWLKQNAVGQTMPNMNTAILAELPLMVASSREEEDKIANILSKWDKAITSTEKLIENSKQQKKALMQQLLTGKKRLMNPASGRAFDDVWEYVRAGNVFLTRSNKKHNSDLPILAITQDQGAIPRDFIDYKVSVTSDSISGYKVVEPGDFIISLRSFQGGIEYSRYKGICSPAYVILYPKLEIVDTFYKYHLKSHSFIQAMKSRLEGIRDGKIISYKYFSEIKLPQPSLDEQEKIASVLTAADKEIEVLEAKLAHFKQEKKALMQQLLTGKRRVKVNLDMEIAI